MIKKLNKNKKSHLFVFDHVVLDKNSPSPFENAEDLTQPLTAETQMVGQEVDNTITNCNSVSSVEDQNEKGDDKNLADDVVEADQEDTVEDGKKKKTKPKEKEVIVPVNLLNDTYTNLSAKFNEQNPEFAMSKTTFWKNTPEYFPTKGKKKTDMYHICEYGKMARRQDGKEVTGEGKKCRITKTGKNFIVLIIKL
jgi:hypothetical protein